MEEINDLYEVPVFLRENIHFLLLVLSVLSFWLVLKFSWERF